MEDKTLQAVIRLKDELSKPLRDAHKAIEQTKNVTNTADESLKEIQRTTEKTADSFETLRQVMKGIEPIILTIKDKVSPILDRVKGLLKQLGKNQVVLKIKDKVSPVIDKVKGILKSITSKAWSAMLKAKDQLTPVVNKVTGLLKGITKGTYTALIKAKDMASSVIGKIKGLLAGLAAGVTIGIKVGIDELGAEQMNKLSINRVLKNAGVSDFQKVGDEYYKYLEQYAKETPFSDSEVAYTGTKSIQMAKGDLDEAKKLNELIGNTKAFVGDNRTMQEVVEAYQSAQQGNMESLNNMLGENYSNFEQAQVDIAKKYGGLVQEMSKTIPGLISTLKGNVTTALKDMVKPFEPIIQGALKGIIGKFDEIVPKLTEFATKVADGFKAFSKSQEAAAMLETFKGIFETAWSAMTTVIDTVSPVIKSIFDWIGEHSVQIQNSINDLGDVWNTIWNAVKVVIEAVSPVIGQILEFIMDHTDELKSIVKKFGDIWSEVWKIAGPCLETAWKAISPVLDFIINAIDKALGVVNGLIQGFKNLVDIFKSGDVQSALSNSSAGNGNNTYQSTMPKGKAIGLDRVPYDGYIAKLHEGESVLPRRDADKWRSNKGNNGIQIAKIADTIVVREEADIDKITSGIVRKIQQQRIITQ